VVRWLVEHHADVNAADKEGQTVLHSAAYSDELEVVRWLKWLKHHADVDKEG